MIRENIEILTGKRHIYAYEMQISKDQVIKELSTKFSSFKLISHSELMLWFVVHFSAAKYSFDRAMMEEIMHVPVGPDKPWSSRDLVLLG